MPKSLIRAAACTALWLTAVAAAPAGDAVQVLGGVGGSNAPAQEICYWRYRVGYAPVYVAPYYAPPPVYADPVPYSYAPPPVAPQESVAVAPPAQPRIAVAFTGRRISAVIALTDAGVRVDAARTPQAPRPADQPPPPPRPGDTFRYDGGPAIPVPMPDGTRPAPGAEEPAPATVPAVNRVRALLARRRAGTSPAEQAPRPRPSDAGSPAPKN
jgi:translation initiation factor IF-2